MYPLLFRIRMSNLRPWFTEPEAQRPEEALTLTDTQMHRELLLDEGGQRLAVPEVRRDAYRLGRLSECTANDLQLFGSQARWPARPLFLLQTSQAILAIGAYPVLVSARGIAQRRCCLAAGHALGHEQNSMESVIIAGFVGAVDFVLESQNGQGGVRDGQRLHTNMKPLFCSMRKYL